MEDAEKLVYTVLEVCMAVLCCLGNALVIVAVGWCRSLCQATFCFVVLLAVADFLVGLVAIPLAVVVDGHLETGFYSCLFICCVELVLTQASVNSLLAIAVDRYLRVLNPLRYRGTIKPLNLCAAITACWLSAILLGLIPMFGWHKENPATNTSLTISCQFMAVIPMSYLANFNFLVCTLFPTVFMAVLYFIVFKTISKQLKKGVAQAPESRTFYKKERKLANSLVLVLVLYALCWFPLYIMNILAYYNVKLPPSAFHIGVLLNHANSAVNPIVYAFKIRKIRTAFRTLLMKWSNQKEWEQNNVDFSYNSTSIVNRNVKIRQGVVRP